MSSEDKTSAAGPSSDPPPAYSAPTPAAASYQPPPPVAKPAAVQPMPIGQPAPAPAHLPPPQQQQQQQIHVQQQQPQQVQQQPGQGGVIVVNTAGFQQRPMYGGLGYYGQPNTMFGGGGVAVVHTGGMTMAPNTVVIGGAPGMTNNSYPCSMKCPHCEANITTRCDYSINTSVIVWVIILFFVFFPICWVPLVINSCKDVSHFCPNCQKKCGQRFN